MAERSYEGNLGRQVSVEDVSSPTGVTVADPLKVDLELREIFARINHGDPTGSSEKAGNRDAHLIPFTTPTAVDTEAALAHGLGRTPVSVEPIAPARAGGSFCGSLYMTKDADATYLYLAVRAATDTARKTAVIVA